MEHNAVLILEDGTVFPGVSFGAKAKGLEEIESAETESGTGELIFNTGMTGYYEILTDPSYTGQIILMTYPLIGNYGVDTAWSETAREEGAVRPVIKPAALAVRKLYRGEVPRGRRHLDEVLDEAGVPGIEQIDTRALTLRIRKFGSLRGMILSCPKGRLQSNEAAAAVSRLTKFPSMEGRNLLNRVGTVDSYPLENSKERKEAAIAVIDYGIKANILRELAKRNISFTVFPSDISDPQEILQGGYTGVMLSNGPGDPASLSKQITFLRSLLGQLPLAGICLGHQLISLALGAETYKMKFGHHGSNHPVKDNDTGKVFVTSQNHGFAVNPKTLPPDVTPRFVNANDGTIEGITHTKLPVMSVQFHPEASPGPLDSLWLFDEFLKHMKSYST